MEAEDKQQHGADDQKNPYLCIHGVPVYFCEDWRTGIGGGLWSTGLSLGRYFGTAPAALSLQRIADSAGNGLSVLELGSGNGFLAVCIAALAAARNIDIRQLVVTDDADHLDMIRKTIAENSHACSTVRKVTVMEHLWGVFSDVNSTERANGEVNIDLAVRGGTVKFDLIIGSDVAYRDFLYDPLIRSIQQFSHPQTVSLIGVTMSDTTPDFFARLDQAGMAYQKFADFLIEPEYRGTTFGIFVIQPKQQ